MIKKLILNKQLSIGIILLLVLGAVLVFPTGASETVDSPFGEWQVSITATDEEGNIKPLSVVNNMLGQLLSINYQGQEVTTFTYTLKAGATGDGYDTCELDMSNAVFAAKIESTDIYMEPADSVITLSLDGTMQTAFEMTLHADLANHIGLSDGTYNLVFYLQQGDYRFRGVPDGEWQTSSSIPQTTIQIEKLEEQKTCYKCDGNGGVSTTSVGESQSCPSGYQSSPPSCSCNRETKTGEWGPWIDRECCHDGYRETVHYRDLLERTCCPGGGCTSWKVYKTNVPGYSSRPDSACDWVTYVTCYRCNEHGSVESEQFENSCMFGWSLTSPSNCACTTETSYSSWGPWVFQNCLPGRLRHDMCTRTFSTQTCCPGVPGYERCGDWIPGGYIPGDPNLEDHRYIVDWVNCFWSAQIVVPSLTFNVETTPFNSYQTDSSHYLGKI